MTPGQWLRRADDLMLRRAGRRVAVLRRRSRRLGPARRAVRAALDAEPTLVGCIAAVLCAALLVAALGGDRTLGGDRPAGAGLPLPSSPPLPQTLATVGPARGASVPAYLGRAADDLRRFSGGAAGRATYAVVDLRAYLTPAAAAATLAGAGVAAVYVRVPSRLPTTVHKLPLPSLAALPASLQSVAALAAAGVRSYTGILRAYHATDARERAQRRSYERLRRAQRLEAAQYRHGVTCRCVFAAVVHAGAAQLTGLARRAQVRAVDPAPPSVALSGLTVCPLRPDSTTVVPETDTCVG